MKKNLHFIILIFLITGTSVISNAQKATYVGSQKCSPCHAVNFTNWTNSGHPYKFTVIHDAQAPVYPNFVQNYEETWLDSLGDGTHTWNDIAGVIGGFGWKVRFVGTDGYIIGTAGSSFSDAGMGHNQFNFYDGENLGWVSYSATNDHKIYNYSCFKCHTTGGDTTGTWLSGVNDLGTFSEGGIGCESCHGPGSNHVAAPSKTNIDKVYEQVHLDNALGGLSINGVVQHPDTTGNDVNFMCGTCHNRGYDNKIDAHGGFVKHHEQWDEFTHTDHYNKGFNCITCHDQHKRTIWNGDGIMASCTSCHSTQVATNNHPGNATCIDCHMPYSDKSGATRGQSGFKGDIRSHLYKITVDTNSMFTEDGKWVKDDAEREASLSPAYSCLGCHNNDPNDDIKDMTLAEAVSAAKDNHKTTSVRNWQSIKLGLYPNPTTGYTNISFHLINAGNVSIKAYNSVGQLVYEVNRNYPSGTHVYKWNAQSNTGANVTPGYYFIRVSSDNLSSTQKLILLK